MMPALFAAALWAHNRSQAAEDLVAAIIVALGSLSACLLVWGR